VLSQRRSLFRLEYPCHAPHEMRWFVMSVTPLRTAAGGAVVVHADVTQRRRAEDTLRESEAQYRSMVSALDEGILIFDMQARLQACNPQAERFFGMELEQLRAPGQLEQWQALRPDGTPMRFSELPLGRTLRSGQPVRDALLGVRMARGLRWLMVNAEPVLDETTGLLSAVVTTFSDITERQAAEDQLRKLSLAVEQSPIAITISNPVGRIEYVNDAYTRITGFTRDGSRDPPRPPTGPRAPSWPT
jgi:two-component system sensor histidine kinase/response regulator